MLEPRPLANLPHREIDATANELCILSEMTTDQLRKELSRALDLTARNLMRLALIVRALEERGEDLSDLRLGLLTYLRQIAYGAVLPEVVVRFAESPTLIKAIAALPMPDQTRLAAGDPVDLVVPRGEHGHDIRRADPLRMTVEQIRQVFAKGRIRDEAEQILVLEGVPANRSARNRYKAKVGSITVDRRNGGLVIGREFVAAAQVVEALAILAEGSDDDDSEEAYSSPIVTHLTISQHDALKDAARRGRTNVTRLVRRALAAYGLFAAHG